LTLTASLARDWFQWDTGAVLTNLVASAIWVPLTYMVALRHLHCVERGCYRPATVPIKGTTGKACKKHAALKGHTH
jgi:hypothetical protein